MPTYNVIVGYEWKTPYFREIPICAEDAEAARAKALSQAAADPLFWSEVIDGDGEAGPTEVWDVSEANGA